MSNDSSNTTQLPTVATLPTFDAVVWMEACRAERKLNVRTMSLRDLDAWAFLGDPLCLAHKSGYFFSIEGVRIDTDYGAIQAWEQPILRQPEVGLLGILSRVKGGVRQFLMQAKAEPGLINHVQLSPTVQATFSNYSRVHGGSRTIFLEYFIGSGQGRVLVDRVQGEMARRFIRKSNRNMVVEVHEEVDIPVGFRWLSMGQIKRLLRLDNQVNMDVRSVLSCIPFTTDIESPADSLRSSFAHDLFASAVAYTGLRHTDDALRGWLSELRIRHHASLIRLPIDGLEGWRFGELEIGQETGRQFSVIGVEVEAIYREVEHWHQPLLKESGCGLQGFVLQHFDGVLHFLVQACLAPGGSNLFELGPTVLLSDDHSPDNVEPDPQLRFGHLFRFAPEEWIRFNALQSYEGGRFYHSQNRCMIIELPPHLPVETSATHRWMTLRQIQHFVEHGDFNMEGRSLIACLDLGERDKCR